MFNVELILACGIILAVVYAIVEKDRSISTFFYTFSIGCAGTVWTLFLATYIVPQIVAIV